jgi:hypothetical protein
VEREKDACRYDAGEGAESDRINVSGRRATCRLQERISALGCLAFTVPVPADVKHVLYDTRVELLELVKDHDETGAI